MRLKNLTLKNFRKFDTLTEEFGDVNKLTGRNGEGKTTVKEAILYALYGIDNSGSNRLNESLIKNGEIILESELEMADGSHLKRVKNNEKSKAMWADPEHDKYEFVAQRDLDSILPNKVLFQSIFDVGYFFTLEEKEQRDVVLGATPPIDRKKLFSELYVGDTGFYDKYNVDLTEGYASERVRLMKKRTDLTNDVADLSRGIQFTWTSDEIIAQQRKVADLEKLVADMPIKDCSECGQKIVPVDLRDSVTALQEAKTQYRLMRDVETKQHENKDKIRKEIQAKNDSIKELTCLIDNFAPKGMPAVEFDIKVKPMIKFANTLLPGITIETSKKQKSGVWEEAFIVKYNDVQYSRLSTGEKKKVSLVFSEMLDKLIGYEVGIKFVDHMESITGKLPKVEGQLFLAQVTEEEYKLTIVKGESK